MEKDASHENDSQHTPMPENNQEHDSPPMTHGDEHLFTDVTLLALHSSQGQQPSTHWQAPVLRAELP